MRNGVFFNKAILFEQFGGFFNKTLRIFGQGLHGIYIRVNLSTAYSFLVRSIKNTLLMNKSELIDAMAEGAGISKVQAKAALDAFTGAVTSTLAAGDKLTLIGFGTFSISERSAREGRNPQTGATINIAAKRVARFKAGAELDSKLN